MTTQPRPSGVVAVQKSEHAGRVAKLDHGQNAMPWLYLHTLKVTSPRSMSMNGIVALCMRPQSQKRGLATLCCRKCRGEVSVNFRGNTSTGGLKLGGHLSPAARTVAGMVRGGAVTLPSEPAPQAGAPEPAVGFKMHLAWCQPTSELFGWGACCGCCTRVTAALRFLSCLRRATLSAPWPQHHYRWPCLAWTSC